MKNKILFIILNVLASLISFVKSFLFLKYLDDVSLGVIVLFQAVISIFGLFQIGLLNGGYRLFSIENEKNNYKTINNLITSYVSILIIVLLIVGVTVGLVKGYDTNIIIFGVIIGGIGLLQNWFSNILIAKGNLREINFLNIITNIISLCLVPLIYFFATTGAILSISSLYVFFVILVLLRNKDLRPTKFILDINLFKRILLYGFVPYLSGIIYLVNNQIDRFFIKFAISTEALGRFYLAFTFISLFYMVPSSINNLFFPRTMNLYSENKIKEVFINVFYYFITNIIYSAIVIIGVYCFADFFVEIIFPEKIYQLKYVYYLVPGLIAMVLSNPLSLVLNVAYHYRSIMIGQLLAFISYFVVLLYLYYNNNFTLENIAWCKSLQGIFVLIYYISTFVLLYKGVVNRKYIKE